MARRLHIKICEGHDLKKMDTIGKSDPYVVLRLKSQDKKQALKTQVISNSLDPIWNQEFDITAVDPNDTLFIDMYDEDIKNDDKMMDRLEYPVSTWQVGAPVDRKEIEIKLKKKKAGKLIFEVSAFPAEGVEERAVNLEQGTAGTNGCKLHIKAFDAHDVLKMDAGGKSDPYLRFRFKNNKDSTIKTQIISNTRDPIWNQELYMTSQNRDADVLEVDMLDEDIKNDDKMMDKIEIPLKDHPIGSHYVFDNDIKRKKKAAGHLHFEIDFEDADGTAGTPGQDVQTRDVTLDEGKIDQSYMPKPAHIWIKAHDGQNLKDMDVGGKSDPYMKFYLKDHKDAAVKTQVISNNRNPVWNQELILNVPDLNKENILVVNMYDEDLKKDDKMMNELEFDLKERPQCDFNEDIKLKKKDAGHLHFEYQVRDGPAPVEGQGPAQPCKLIVHAVKAEKVRKMDANASDPYLTLQLKGDPDSLMKTKVIKNDLNPVWNQTFEFYCKDWNTDTLLVNMWDKDIKNDDKMMNELELPLNKWPIDGGKIDWQDDVKLKKKDAGRLFLEFQVQSVDNQPQVQTRDIVLEENNQDYCNFSLGNYGSDFSTSFTGYTNCSHSLSKIHSSEERFHHHHHGQAVTRSVEPTTSEQKPQKTGESIKGVVKQAAGLPKSDTNGTDAYVVLSIISRSGKDKKADKAQTEVVKNSQDPVWNYEFNFPKAKKGDSLRCEVFQKGGALTKDFCIGVCEIALKDLRENEPVEQAFKLDKPPKLPSVLKKIVEFGQLTLSLTHEVTYA